MLYGRGDTKWYTGIYKIEYSYAVRFALKLYI
jgi:hypothetical protein